MKKLSILLLSGFLLGACADGGENEEEVIDEEIANAEEETKIQQMTDTNGEIIEKNEIFEDTNDLKTLGEFMIENSFISAFGQEALENYLEIDEALTYLTLDETGEITGSNGSTMEEVIELFDNLPKKASVHAAKDEAHTLSTITFHYLDPDQLPENEADEFTNYADISYAFENDQLYLSNIAPGWFEINIDQLIDAKMLNQSKTTEDLPINNPGFKILTLGKININNQPFIQLMAPTKFENTDGQEIPISHYLYFVNDQLVFANYIPFYETSENLPLYSIQAIDSYFQEMKETEN